MTPYQQELAQLIGGHIRYAGISREGYLYLIVSKPDTSTFFYLFVQADAEGNGAGFLHITTREKSRV